MILDIEALKTSHDEMDLQIGALETSKNILESKQITNDYFYMNSDYIEVPANGVELLHTFSVPNGEMLDLNVNITSNESGRNNSLWLRLYQDGQLVASSIDDGDGNDDNASLALIFKKVMT